MVSFFANLRHDLRVYGKTWRTQFKAASHLRGAFSLQIFGMVVNNLGLMVAWLFLFERFGTINGWAAADFIGVQGVHMVIIGMVLFLNSGFFELPRYVDTGSFDSFLTKPASVLVQVSSSRVEIPSIGDIGLGIILLTWYIIAAKVSFVALLMFIPAVIIGVILVWCFVLGAYLLAFYVYDSDKVARSIMFLFFDTGIYPTGVISGPMRLVLLTVIPGLFIGAVPLDVLRGVGWEYLLIGLAVALTWLMFTMWLFKKALRKYESANLVGAR